MVRMIVESLRHTRTASEVMAEKFHYRAVEAVNFSEILLVMGLLGDSCGKGVRFTIHHVTGVDQGRQEQTLWEQ